MPVTEELPHEFEELFNRIDENGDRRIDCGEFSGLMLEMDGSATENKLRRSFAAIDTNRDGHVSIEELRNWWPRR